MLNHFYFKNGGKFNFTFVNLNSDQTPLNPQNKTLTNCIIITVHNLTRETF